MILKSEFAKVTVELDESANGPRLMIRDEFSQRAIYLDPLELASIAWLDHEDLAPFVDPGKLTDQMDDERIAALLDDLDMEGTAPI